MPAGTPEPKAHASDPPVEPAGVTKLLVESHLTTIECFRTRIHKNAQIVLRAFKEVQAAGRPQKYQEGGFRRRLNTIADMLDDAVPAFEDVCRDMHTVIHEWSALHERTDEIRSVWAANASVLMHALRAGEPVRVGGILFGRSPAVLARKQTVAAREHVAQAMQLQHAAHNALMKLEDLFVLTAQLTESEEASRTVQEARRQ